MNSDYRINMLGYFVNELEKFRKNHRLAYDSMDVDGVHDLRVCVKKIKAFLKLLSALNEKSNYKKNSEIFKTTAKSAGEFRDIQVQIEILEKTGKVTPEKFPVFGGILKNYEMGSYIKFKRLSPKYLPEELSKAEKRIVLSMLSVQTETSRAKALAYFDLLNKKLLGMCNVTDGYESNLHEMRKIAKELHYTFEIIDTSFQCFDNPKDFYTGIKKLHQALGNWHDYEVGLELINSLDKKTTENISAETDFLKKVFSGKKQNLLDNFENIFTNYSEIKIIPLEI